MSDESAVIAKTVSGMAVSAIKEMAIRSAAVPGAASLTWGLPSFPTPESIRRAIEEKLESDPDIGKYALPDGLPALRAAAAGIHAQHTGVNADPDAEVMITCGNMQGVNAVLHALLDPGDEVIVTDPGFASHSQQISLCGGRTVYWQLDEAQDWALDLDALPDLISARTKALILVSPSNPTGRIFTEDELRRVGDIARSRGVLIVLDDPYCHFTYENRDRYFNLSAVPDLREHLAYLFTFSKTYAMSGWRVGYAILPAWLKRQVLKVHDATIICTPRISQVAALTALTGDQGHLAEFEAALAARRTLICERLDVLAHAFTYVRPQGAYYVFPKILARHENSVEFAYRLLDEAKVTVTPGAAFGPTGEHHVRMAFCVDEDTINRAFDQLDGYFAG